MAGNPKTLIQHSCVTVPSKSEILHCTSSRNLRSTFSIVSSIRYVPNSCLFHSLLFSVCFIERSLPALVSLLSKPRCGHRGFKSWDVLLARLRRGALGASTLLIAFSASSSSLAPSALWVQLARRVRRAYSSITFCNAQPTLPHLIMVTMAGAVLSVVVNAVYSERSSSSSRSVSTAFAAEFFKPSSLRLGRDIVGVIFFRPVVPNNMLVCA